MIGIITVRAPKLFQVSVVRKVQKCYLWDHFHCRDTFVWKFLQKEMKWSLRCSTRPGKKVPDGVTYILSNAFFHLVHTISENSVAIELIVNTDQTMVIYAASASETYAPKGSKQVEVVGKDERQGFTAVVGISMSGEVLPFQGVFAGTTSHSLPSLNAGDYEKATKTLKFRFVSGGENHWSTLHYAELYPTHPCTILFRP